MEPIDILINSLGGGGAERQASQLADQLTDTRIILLEDAQAYPTKAEIVKLTHVTPTSSPLWKIAAYPSQLMALNEAITAKTVLSFLWRANVLNVISKKFKPHRVILSERQALAVAEHPSIKTKLWLKTLGLFYRHADRIVVNSKGTQDDLIRYCGVSKDRTRVVYNAVDSEALHKRAVETQETPARFIVTSGRLDPQKGQDNLLRAFAHIQDKEVQLVILGTGPSETHLKKMAEDLNIADRVTFAGFQKNPFAWIARAELFVLTSQFEGFPNVVLEALALGVPVVSVDCRYGPRELLAPDTNHQLRAAEVEQGAYGVLVPPVTTGSRTVNEPLTYPEKCLVEAIDMLIGSPGTRAKFRAAGPERAAACTPEKITAAWKEALI